MTQWYVNEHCAGQVRQKDECARKFRGFLIQQFNKSSIVEPPIEIDM